MAGSAGRKLDRVEMFAAARWLGDRPHTVLPVHALLTGRGEAWVADGDDPADPRALLVRMEVAPAEPAGFGRDAAALADLLLGVGGWSHVNVGDALMQTLPPALERRTGRQVRRYGDLYHVLLKLGPTFAHPSVRLLNEDDVGLFADAPAPVAAADRRTAFLILHEGLCAGAVVDGRMVSRAQTYARTPRHADLGVATAESHRGQGLVTACASLLVDELRKRKVIPVWSCGEANEASRRVAEKLGFAPIASRVYLSLAPAAR